MYVTRGKAILPKYEKTDIEINERHSYLNKIVTQYFNESFVGTLISFT